MKNILSSEDFYRGDYFEGKEPEEGCEYEYGTVSDLCSNPNIDNDSIVFDDDLWEDSKYDFIENLKDSIAKYEKRYHTKVVSIALGGSLGKWDGTVNAGKICDINNLSSVLQIGCDNLNVDIDEDNTIVISGSHHDGSNCMNIYLLTDNKLRQLGYTNTDNVDSNFINKMIDKFSPMKYSFIK